MSCLARQGALILACVLVLGCSDGPVGDATGTPDPWDEFGLPIKGDDPGCNASERLCWPERDGRAFRALMAAEDALLLSSKPPSACAQAIKAALDALRHKLSPGAIDALGRLMTDEQLDRLSTASDVAVRWLDSLRRDVFAGLYEGYFAAHAVSLGATARGDNKYDVFAYAEDFEGGAGLTVGMQESLRILKESGVVGHAYALLMAHTGVLDEMYHVGDLAWPAASPIDDQIDALMAEARWATVRLNTLTNLENLIPFVGIAVSIPHSVIANFRIRARLVFRLMALYGVDIRSGQNLLLASQVLLSALDVFETRLLLGATMAIPIVTGVVVHLTGAVLPQQVFTRYLVLSLRQMLSKLGRLGESVVGRALARAGAEAAGKQVLGYATLGASIIADVTLATIATSRVGTHADMLTRPWLPWSLRYGNKTFHDEDIRTCLFRVFGQISMSDGQLHDQETLYLAGQLERLIYREATWTRLDDYDQQVAIAALSSRDSSDCIAQTLSRAGAQERRAIIGLVATLVYVDGAAAPTETSGLEQLIEMLMGDALLGDGTALRRVDIESMLAQIEASVTSDDVMAMIFEAGEADGFGGANLILGLERVDELTRDRVRCALGDDCLSDH